MSVLSLVLFLNFHPLFLKRMEWLYVWSPRYRIFHEILQATTRDISGFLLRPLFAEQKFFTPLETGAHFLTGIPIKLFAIVNYIKKNPGAVFFFSDVDLVVFPHFSASDLDPYLLNDITTMKECHPTVVHNIGCLLIRCNEKTLAFFERVLSRTHNEKLLDQVAFNLEVPSFPGTIGLFSNSQFLQSNALTDDESSYKIIQCLTSQDDPKHVLVEKLTSINHVYDIEPFLSFAPSEVQEELRTQTGMC